jgi:hypothetical protein
MWNLAKMAVRLAKIWALAQLDPTRKDSECLTYHMKRLWDFFDQANKVVAVHSEAAWQYPMHLAHWLHENLDNNPEKSTTDIVVNKFKHLKLAESREEYTATLDPDVISFTPIVSRLFRLCLLHFLFLFFSLFSFLSLCL